MASDQTALPICKSPYSNKLSPKFWEIPISNVAFEYTCTNFVVAGQKQNGEI